MNDYKPKKSIDEYIENNDLNARLYQVLLQFNDSETCEGHNLKKQPLEIFNHAYAICEELQKEKHPEVAALQIWDRLREKFLICETNIIFSCVYVILFFSQDKNPNMKFFLSRFRHKIDAGFFQAFEPLIREELTYLTTLTDNFETLKKQANEIKDLDERELFYTDYLTRYKQAKQKGNILQQISDEIDLIQRTKELSTTDTDSSTDIASLKIRSVLILEMLKEMNLGPAHNDLTKICKLISYLTGNSYKSIYTELQKGINFTNHHTPQITQANKILTDINASFTIDKQKQY